MKDVIKGELVPHSTFFVIQRIIVMHIQCINLVQEYAQMIVLIENNLIALTLTRMILDYYLKTSPFLLNSGMGTGISQHFLGQGKL